MNVFEKLNLARVTFQSRGIKKNGQNKFAGYNYFELTDILPACNAICSEIKASCIVSFGKELATLKFVDAEKPEDFIEFTCPMSEANQKGCQPVQNSGSVQTYIKRYLYQNCFEIAENDGLDMTTGKDEKINEMIKSVLDAIKAGKFNKQQTEYANWAVNNRNYEGLERVVGSLVEQEAKTQQ